MDDTNSEGARERQDPSQDAEAHRAADSLRDQIAALRRQVKDAQETLRDHKQRQESRSFKR